MADIDPTGAAPMTQSELHELPSRYDPHAVENGILEMWERGRYYAAKVDAGGEPYSIVIPPPNVTGFLHIGHALNNTLQDILTRWRRMQGRDTLWLPGTDHAGIATQHVVERDLWEREKLDRRDMGREKFLQRVWEWKERSGSRIISQLKRLGCSCDWTRERFTMDEGLSRAVLTVFKQLYDEGLIYRGDYLVNWSPKLQTALSDDEVVYQNVKGHLWTFRYPLEDGSGAVEVATTRPETMLGDTAVAIHPEDPRYKDLIGKHVILPLINRRIPIIGDSFVDKDFGTGAVKVTPAHDPNDYEMGRRHGLEFINLLNPDGTLNADAGDYMELNVHEARKRVVEDLETQGLLVKVEDHEHSVGHCYRSGCVIEPYMSKQWFVRMRPLCEPAIAAVREGRTRFVPKHYENEYFRWLENVRDWCISRQLWWGHRIPIYECEDCGHIVCEVDRPPGRCEKCGGERMKQDPDVLDTWFSSALWPFSTFGWPDATPELARYYPTSVLITGFDIIFFWVARMIVMGLKFMGDVPFREVAINPIVRDAHGKKMSKSAGNAIDPLDVIEEIGADSIRLALTSYPFQTRHISLSEERFTQMRNFTNKLWNVTRLTMMNTRDLPAETLARALPADDLELEDRWILSELARAIERADEALESFAFDLYVDDVYKFTWNRYCDWYVELVKDRLYGKGPEGSSRTTERSRRAAQVVLLTVLEHILRLLHPVAPFITEEIWGKLKANWGEPFEEPGEGRTLGLAADALMVAAWPRADAFAKDDEAEEAMGLIQETIGHIRRIRGEMGVQPGMATDIEIVTANGRRLAILEANDHFQRSLVKIGELRLAAEPDGQGFRSTSAFEDVVIHVHLPAELLDQERVRLDKDIARLEKGVGGVEKKLSNEKFLGGAPAEVVQSERERMEKMRGELRELQSRRAGLN